MFNFFQQYDTCDSKNSRKKTVCGISNWNFSLLTFKKQGYAGVLQ